MHESGENYLESILILLQKNGVMRSIDVANYLSFSKPSVSRAMGLLKENQLITIDGETGHITLTDLGYKKASAIYERHNFIGKFLMLTLNVPEDIAYADACKMEHILSEESFMKMKTYVIEHV